MSHLPLPSAAAQFVSRKLRDITNPGLLLDKFAPYGDSAFTGFDQKNQKDHIDRIAAASAHGDSEILSSWDTFIATLPHAIKWKQRTIWRLAGQLSRTTTLENGATCLHPIYGFAYLPATGLKGLARTWAHQEEASKEDIQRIFGSYDVRHADESLTTDWSENSGTVVFLESWPEQWPILECDIVNNHHKDYYANAGRESPPGDWEAPNPTYFLAVSQNTLFRFALAQRDPFAPAGANDVVLAANWLKGALCNLGAGAKTAAGYGYFTAPEEMP